jgi:hypothetical protein
VLAIGKQNLMTLMGANKVLHEHIVVSESSIHGQGLVAVEVIPEGSVVWRLDERHQVLSYEALCLLPSDIQALTYQAGDKFILAQDDGQYMNHCCDPNCWWSGDVTLVARRNIQQGEEVTYDYASCEIDPRLRGDWLCNCAAAHCRRRVTAFDCLFSDFQMLHQGHLPSWVMVFIDAFENWSSLVSKPKIHSDPALPTSV